MMFGPNDDNSLKQRQKSRLENQTFHQRRTPPAFRVDNTVPQVEMLGMTVPGPGSAF